MSRPYGPVPLTAGTMASVDVDAGAAFVVIENSSISLDLAVSFQVNSPAQTTYVAGFPWDGYIQAGGSKRLTLPPNDGRWTGRIWMYPISVATYSAATGTTSGYSRAIVTTFGAREEPQDFQGVIRGLDLTSQPRVVSLPNAVSQEYNFTTTMASDPQVIVNLPFGSPITSLPLITGATNVHVYTWNVNHRPLSVGECTIGFTWWQMVGAAPIANRMLSNPLTFDLWKAGGFGPSESVVQAWPNPIIHFGVVDTVAGANAVGLFIHLAAGNGGMTVKVAGGCTADSHNSLYPWAPGELSVLIPSPGDLY